jgi:HK97 family phage major capsid protein
VVGVKSQPGVTLTAFGGANGATPTNFDFLLDGIQTLAAANFTADGIMLAPRTVRTLNGLKDAQNRYLDAPQSVKDVPQYVTNQVPTDLTVGTSAGVCSDCFVGSWPNLLVGFRSTVSIRLNERYVPDEGMIGFIVATRFDVGLAHAAAFNVISGIKP